MPAMLKQVAAVIGNQRVDEQHVGAELDQPLREVAADEAEPAGDHHAPAAVEARQRVIGDSDAAAAAAPADAQVLAADHQRHHSFSTSTPRANDARGS